MNEFRKIEFGFADAQTEGAEAPGLLRDGFLDEDGLVEMALSGRHFIFLGYKGSGKTAIAERAKLLARTDPMLFTKVATLDEFPYGDFKSAAGSGEPQTRYPTVWTWLLLVALFESLEQDELGKETAPAAYRLAAEGLKKLGLIPTPELNSLVVTSSKRSFKLSLPKVFDFTQQKVASAQDLQLGQAVHALRNAAESFPTQGRHVLFLDGLDEILGQRDLQFQALAALMSASTRLNNRFREVGAPLKIVVLCRTDIFDRLPGANINKIRQDHAEMLHWYEDPGHPGRTRLVRLVNLRASRSLERSVNVFSEFLPADINGRPIRKEILDQTRHTPRDLVQLFRYLQSFSHRGERLTPKEVRSAFRGYSLDYFLPEIRNEMHGHIAPADVPKAEQLLTELGRQQFRIKDLEKVQQEVSELSTLDLKAMVKVLFDCSVIGNIEWLNGVPLRTVKYRNPHAQLRRNEKMWLHPAACRALNIRPESTNPPFRRRRQRRPSRSKGG